MINNASESGQSTLRHILYSFAAVIVVSIALIAGITLFTSRSQDRIAAEESIHLTKSVVAAITRRLADQTLDYAYWEQAVDNLVTTLDLDWADNNVGIYMHETFGITSSFVLDGANRPLYGMIEGKRHVLDPLDMFPVGLKKLLDRARAASLTTVPFPVTGFVKSGETVHIASVSLLAHTEKPIVTDMVLIFTRALDPAALAKMALNYQLEGLRMAATAETMLPAAMPLTSAAGGTLGFLTWHPKTPGQDMLKWLIPFVVAVFAVFAGIAFVFFRKTQLITSTLGSNLTEIQATQDALKVAKEVAEQANKSKSEFLANMSHELRTPLNSVIGFSSAMEEETFGPLGDDHYREYVGAVQDSGMHLLNLVNDILDISKIEAGEMEFEDKDVNVHDIFQASAKIVANRAVRGEITMDMEISENSPQLRGDSLRLKQILLNLLTNAIKFTPPKGQIRVSASVDASNAMEWQIIDTGVGIPAKDLRRIMLPFEQVRNTVALTHEGTGLGLYLTKSLAEAHGGTLEIESVVGKGTTVKVNFPPERTVAPV
ncbi:MAG TPA: ATP-binding protein [Rhodospirillales bacterium]|nr:ATP-binding protein [Rhodospirillales bacterium]